MPRATATVVAETCSAAQLATLLGLSARRIRELAEAGVIPRARGRYPVADAVAAYCANLREVAAGRRGDGDGGEALDLAAERAKLARSQREAVELKLARDRGQLVDATAVRLGFSTMVRAAVGRLRGVPSKAKGRIPTLTVRDIDILDGLIDDALREVAEGAEVAE
ncbi:MAG: hypothetical protein ACREPV_13820 [Lysobacter sp.]